MYICFLFEGTSPLAATTYAKHTCPHPTPSGQEHHKHSTKKKAKPGTYHPATHQQFTSRSLKQASETAQAWPLVFRVLHAAKTAKNSKYKKRGYWKTPKTDAASQGTRQWPTAKQHGCRETT